MFQKIEVASVNWIRPAYTTEFWMHDIINNLFRTRENPCEMTPLGHPGAR